MSLPTFVFPGSIAGQDKARRMIHLDFRFPKPTAPQSAPDTSCLRYITLIYPVKESVAAFEPSRLLVWKPQVRLDCAEYASTLQMGIM